MIIAGRFRPPGRVVKSGDALPQFRARGETIPFRAQLVGGCPRRSGTRDDHDPARRFQARAGCAHDFSQTPANAIAHDGSAQLAGGDEADAAGSGAGVFEHGEREIASRPRPPFRAYAPEFRGQVQSCRAGKAQTAGSRGSRPVVGRWKVDILPPSPVPAINQDAFVEAVFLVDVLGALALADFGFAARATGFTPCFTSLRTARRARERTIRFRHPFA